MDHNFPSAREYESDFQTRRTVFLRYLASASRGPSFYDASARLAMNQEPARALDEARQLLKKPHGDMFYVYPMMGFYMHNRRLLPGDIHDGVRRIWREYMPYRGDTENHWLMHYTSILLAAQTWPGEPPETWFNGKSSDENYEEAREYIEHWMETVTTIGQGEFDSPHYGAVYLAPLLMLYDFAENPALKLKAQMMLDWELADYAAEYLKGMYCGSHARIYDREVFDERISNMICFGFLYFGDIDFQARLARAHTVWGALSAYRPPEVIVRMATDRSQPYVHRERKRIRYVMRYGKRVGALHKYTYMTRHFGLGSCIGDWPQTLQHHTWDVSFIGSDGNPASVFAIHPYYSNRQLAAFFPELVQRMVPNVVQSKVSYDKPNKVTGPSRFEQLFQHENAIIVLYNIEEGEGHPHVNGYFPKNVAEREQDDSGWVFCRGQDAYVAYLPLRPAEWIEEEEAFFLRSPHLRNGVIMEVGSSEGYDSFDAFKSQIRGNAVDTSQFESDLAIKYTTSRGGRMEFKYDGPRKLNGKKVDVTNTPLFDGPFTKAEVDGQRLELQHGALFRVLDFKRMEILDGVR